MRAEGHFWKKRQQMEFTVLACFHIPEAGACVCVGGGWISWLYQSYSSSFVVCQLMYGLLQQDYNQPEAKGSFKNFICLQMFSIV